MSVQIQEVEVVPAPGRPPGPAPAAPPAQAAAKPEPGREVAQAMALLRSRELRLVAD
jgi:hypothetical protein